MLISTHQMEQFDISAHDGFLGKMRDLYFDEGTWQVRYIVVENGSWFRKHRVLISPQSIMEIRPSEGLFDLNLTREQIRSSPAAADPDKPISREQEIALHEYYGWTPYWRTTRALQLTEVQKEISPPTSAFLEPDKSPLLRSAQTVRGYNVALKVGGIGQVDDFLVNDVSWLLPYLMIGTRKWLPGKKMIIPSSQIEGISWYEKRVFVDIDEEEIKQSPELPDTEIISPEYESSLRSYYWHSARVKPGGLLSSK